jgi:mannosyltransferase OCH1-like enzyme
MTERSGNTHTLPIIQYWDSADIPVEVAEMIATFRNHNSDLRHLVFDETEAEALIAETLTAREAAAFRACAVPAMQSDYFRCCAVLALGGVYSDADIYCVRPLWPLIDSVDDGLLFRNSRGRIVNNFFAFHADHPFMRLAVDVATENIERRVSNEVHKVTGPWVFLFLERLYQLESLEAGRQATAGGRLEQLANSVLHAVGEYGRVAEAFDRLRIEPFDDALGKWIAKPAVHPRYKQTAVHWLNWHEQGREIFK